MLRYSYDRNILGISLFEYCCSNKRDGVQVDVLIRGQFKVNIVTENMILICKEDTSTQFLDTYRRCLGTLLLLRK